VPWGVLKLLVDAAGLLLPDDPAMSATVLSAPR
jgi:hypothetical protein